MNKVLLYGDFSRFVIVDGTAPRWSTANAFRALSARLLCPRDGCPRSR
jgi:hypothetical protein